MSINNINSSNNPQIDNQRVQQQNARKEAVASPNVAAQEDSVSLTQSAQELNKLQAQAYEAPVNKEKVAEIRNSILNGEYRVNPDALASKIAKIELEIFGA